MKWRWSLLCGIWLILCVHAQEQEKPPLPRWSDDDAQRLLTGEEFELDLLFRALADSEQGAEVFSDPSLPRPDFSEEEEASPITEEDLERYFARKPKSFLIDPQKVLGRQEYRDRLSFLKYHDSDSTVGFYVYLFDRKQVLPADIKIESIWRQHFSDAGPTVLLFYYMSEPERADIFVSPDLMKSVGRAERARALQSAINLASVKSRGEDQLDGFCMQMSNRIYWMEKALEAGVIAPPEAEPVVKAPPLYKRAWASFLVWWQEWKGPCLICLGVILTGLLVSLWQRLRRQYRLAPVTTPPRLGGSQAAGVGAVVSFANPYLSASAQREKTPDNLDLL